MRRIEERLGDYELLYEIKSGGMGEVFLGRKQSAGGFEKLVAIKTIRQELSSREELRTMFFDEARLMARLDHPAVAQVYDFGEQESRLYLAMEYVQGVRFTDLVRQGTPPAMAVQLMAQACGALHAAHSLQDLDGRDLEVVHRDVSPENLMLSFDGHVKVLDFGIALMRGRQAPATELGTIKGKPPYLAPEQVRGRRIDRRTDIWSVGVVLWELLTGRNLFEGESMYAVALAIEEQEIPPPSAIAGQLPEGLDAIVSKALARDPEERYQSGEDMAADLRALAGSLGAPSIREFAEATLQSEREEHRQWLREVLRGESEEAPIGRPTGMRTALAGEELAALTTLPQDPLAELAASPEEENAVSLGPEAGGRGGRALLLFLLLLGVGLGSWLLLRDGEGEPVAAITTELDAASADAQAPSDEDPLLPADAALGPADAGSAPTRVAEKKKSRRAPRRKVDAAPRREAPPDPELATSKEPVGVGKITVAAEPFALVRVDGEEIGATPLFGRSLPAGTHVVELIHPDTGKVRLRKTIELSAGGHERVIDR